MSSGEVEALACNISAEASDDDNGQLTSCTGWRRQLQDSDGVVMMMNPQSST